MTNSTLPKLPAGIAPSLVDRVGEIVHSGYWDMVKAMGWQGKDSQYWDVVRAIQAVQREANKESSHDH